MKKHVHFRHGFTTSNTKAALLYNFVYKLVTAVVMHGYYYCDDVISCLKDVT